MREVLRHFAQFAVILAMTGTIAAFSNWPTYRQVPADSAVVVLTFVHRADRQTECRRLSADEIARLPANMRRPFDCPRARRPIHIELEIDGSAAFRADLPPTGIAGDGPSRVYERFVVSPGVHELAVRMRDTPRSEGFDHERHERLALMREQMLVIDFRSDSGEFVFH